MSAAHDDDAIARIAEALPAAASGRRRRAGLSRAFRLDGYDRADLPVCLGSPGGGPGDLVKGAGHGYSQRHQHAEQRRHRGDGPGDPDVPPPRQRHREREPADRREQPLLRAQVARRHLQRLRGRPVPGADHGPAAASAASSRPSTAASRPGSTRRCSCRRPRASPRPRASRCRASSPSWSTTSTTTCTSTPRKTRSSW